SLFHLPDLAPLACPPTTPTGSLCGDAWGQVAPLIGADAGDAGRGGGVPDGPVLNPVSYDEAPRGCHCRLSTPARTRAPALPSLLLLLFASHRRAKRAR